LTLYRHTGKKYASVQPNKDGRLAIPDLDLEIGLLDGWVRYWHKNESLLLPPDLQRDLDEARRVAETERRRADELQKRLDEAERELARYRAGALPHGRRNEPGENH
jgi:hypothetical protein